MGQMHDNPRLDDINNLSYVALRTNLLYDALLIPNLGVDVILADNWSIYAELMYAGWDMPKKHFYWDLYGVQYGVRRYFGNLASKRRFSGHHIDLYGLALAYDLQAGHIGQQTVTINAGAGLSYGYSFPISPKLNLDLELGVGYLGGKYYEYIVEDEHYTWRGTIQRSWFGPTKASVSLVWLIKSRNKTER